VTVRGGLGNKTWWEFVAMNAHYYKIRCELCSKEYDERNGHKLCTSCYIKATFDIEELVWQGEALGIREYIEYKKLANALGSC
jgi:hypothetical protein